MKKYFCFATKLFKNIPLSNRTGNNTIPTSELTLDQHLNSKVHIIHYFFCHQVPSYDSNLIQTSYGHQLHLVTPLLQYFQFFNLFVQICEIGGHTFSNVHTKFMTPHHFKLQISNRMSISLPHKIGYHVIWQSLGMNMTYDF